MVSYYVDSCIWLNLLKKEGDESKGKPYWMIAEEFFEKCEKTNSIIYYSGYVLKELRSFLSDEEFIKLNKNLSSSNFVMIKLSDEEYFEARKIESEINYEISFYDILHMLAAKRTKSILITRDKKLIETAREYDVEVKKPEELI